jgi:tetratricopeptide (TPR) repeat protein
MTNTQWGIVAVKMNIIVFVYANLGNSKLAYQTSQEALRIGNASGDIHSKGFANLALGVSYYLKGCLKEAEDHLLKSFDLLQKSNPWESMKHYKNYLKEQSLFIKISVEDHHISYG